MHFHENAHMYHSYNYRLKHILLNGSGDHKFSNNVV